MKTKSRVLFAVLAVLMLISLTACKDNTDVSQEASLWDDATYTQDTQLGEGDKTVEVEVKAEDKSITFTVKTNAETLADALLEHSLIEGEDSQYGIYIKKVNGIQADYETDGYYWSLLKNGEYLMTGADTTSISSGEHYELVRTK